MTNKSKDRPLRVVNVDEDAHTAFKVRCAGNRWPMVNRASFLLELDNVDVILVDLTPHKDESREAAIKRSAKEVAKEITDNRLLANLANRIRLTEDFIERAKKIAKKEGKEVGEKFLLEYLLAKGEAS